MHVPQTSLPYLTNLPNPETLVSEEIQDLSLLLNHGFIVSPSLIIPAAIEENYYRLNNLPEQLQRLFKDVNMADPDEDDIEDLEDEALAIFKKHFLLDEFIDTFYEALSPLSSKLTVRRPQMQGKTSTKGRPTLIALKDLWAKHWTFDAITERLSQTQSIAIEAQSVIIQAVDDGQEYFEEAIQKTLDKSVKIAKDDNGQITRITYKSN